MDEIEKALKSIGKTNFVLFFEDYRELACKDKITTEEKMALANKLLIENHKASKISGQLIRISYAITIFKNGFEKEALNKIIQSNHSSISTEIKQKAMKYLKEDYKLEAISK